MSAPQTLEEKQAEKARLMKAYKAKRRAEWAEMCEQEPRLAGFKKALKHERNPRGIACKLADSWLRFAPLKIRTAALRLILDHSDRERRFMGLAPLDDPLPPDTNLFFVSKELLQVN